MLITIEKTETRKVKVEIDLPAYYKWGTDYYKIITDETAIVVCDWQPELKIMKSDFQKGILVGAVREGSRITEKEFLDAFHRVGEKVKRELIKAIETDGWKAQEQAELKKNALAEVETTQS